MKISLSSFLQPFIYNIIQEEIKNAENSHRAPMLASHNALMKIVHTATEDAINRLKEDGLIISYNNINKMPMYQIVKRK